MKKIISIYLILTFLVISCKNNDTLKLDLVSNLQTFDYLNLKSSNVENLLNFITQDSLDYMYIGDEDIVSGISISYKDKAMLIVYFDRDSSIDINSKVDIDRIKHYEIKLILVYKGKSPSDLFMKINLMKDSDNITFYPER